ncbi:hypothetical protein CEXT_408161 [Caerostris extrusa]|uniref:Uncharacterized protein n=1 Tax=Caerostris extrusa TaxID=172846 RepID=A0AAV4NFP8_CAEEX|nr:hypothetical protein CEXT_408161 [Caerostris extrusa]
MAEDTSLPSNFPRHSHLYLSQSFPRFPTPSVTTCQRTRPCADDSCDKRGDRRWPELMENGVLATISVAVCYCVVSIPDQVGLSSCRNHHLDAAATLLFLVFNYYVSIVLSQSKENTISHPPPFISTSSDRVIANVIRASIGRDPGSIRVERSLRLQSALHGGQPSSILTTPEGEQNESNSKPTDLTISLLLESNVAKSRIDSRNKHGSFDNALLTAKWVRKKKTHPLIQSGVCLAGPSVRPRQAELFLMEAEWATVQEGNYRTICRILSPSVIPNGMDRAVSNLGVNALLNWVFTKTPILMERK